MHLRTSFVLHSPVVSIGCNKSYSWVVPPQRSTRVSSSSSQKPAGCEDVVTHEAPTFTHYSHPLDSSLILQHGHFLSGLNAHFLSCCLCLLCSPDNFTPVTARLYQCALLLELILRIRMCVCSVFTMQLKVWHVQFVWSTVFLNSWRFDPLLGAGGLYRIGRERWLKHKLRYKMKIKHNL